MLFAALMSLSIVALVGASLLRGGFSAAPVATPAPAPADTSPPTPATSLEPKKFPWFWVFLPIAVFSVGYVISLVLDFSTSFYDYGWTMYAPLSDAVSAPLYSNMDPISWGSGFIGIVIGVAGSIVFWRKRRL